LTWKKRGQIFVVILGLMFVVISGQMFVMMFGQMFRLMIDPKHDSTSALAG